MPDDCLAAALDFDDKRIYGYYARKRTCRTDPRVDVTLYALADWARLRGEGGAT